MIERGESGLISRIANKVWLLLDGSGCLEFYAENFEDKPGFSGEECCDWLIISAISRGIEIGIMITRYIFIFSGHIALRDPF